MKFLLLSFLFFGLPAQYAWAELKGRDVVMEALYDDVAQFEYQIRAVDSSLKTVEKNYLNWRKQQSVMNDIIRIFHCRAEKGYLFSEERKAWQFFRESALKPYDEREMSSTCLESGHREGILKMDWGGLLEKSELMTNIDTTVYEQFKTVHMYRKLLKLELDQLERVSAAMTSVRDIYKMLKAEPNPFLPEVGLGYQVLSNLQAFHAALAYTSFVAKSTYEAHELDFVSFNDVTHVEASQYMRGGTDLNEIYFDRVAVAENKFYLNFDKIADIAPVRARRLIKRYNALPVPDGFSEGHLIYPQKNERGTTPHVLTVLRTFDETMNDLRWALNTGLNQVKAALNHRQGLYDTIAKAHSRISDLVNDYNKAVAKCNKDRKHCRKSARKKADAKSRARGQREIIAKAEYKIRHENYNTRTMQYKYLR